MLKIQEKLSVPFLMLLSLPATGMGFALSIQIAALSSIMTNRYGLEVHEVGLVWAGGPIAGILGQVIIGMISDNTWFWGGRRRPFMLIGGILTALMLIALPNLTIISEGLGLNGILGIAVMVTLMLDLSINVSFNPTRSIISDVTPEGKKRTQGYSWMQTISGSFGVLAYYIGSQYGNDFLIYFGVALVLLFSLVPPFLIKEPKDLQQIDHSPAEGKKALPLKAVMMTIKPLWGLFVYNIYVLANKIVFGHDWSPVGTSYVVETACLILTFYLMAEALFKKEISPSQERDSLMGFKKVLAAHSFSWIGMQTMFVYFYSYLQATFPDGGSSMWDKTIYESYFILNSVAALLPALLLEPLSKRFGRVRVHTVSLAVTTLAFAGLWHGGDSVPKIYALMALCGVGWSGIISLTFAIMSQRVEGAQMGTYMGLFNLSVVLPQLLVSLAVGSFVAIFADKSLIFAISTGCLLVSTLAWTQVKPIGQLNQ